MQSNFQDDLICTNCSTEVKVNKIINGPAWVSYLEHGKDVLRDLAELWKSKDFSDIVFQCEGGEFTAHKFIVSARSAVFRAMFSSGMSEAVSNIVKIVDIKLETMKILVEYMYSGRLFIKYLCIEEVTDLLRAADKYEMNALKNSCFNHLIKIMRVNKIYAGTGELVMLADLHNADIKLKFEIQECINKIRGEPDADAVMLPEFRAQVAASPIVFCTTCENFKQIVLNKN